MNFKVRPFAKRDVRGVDAEGTIEGDEYVVSFYGIPFRVPVIKHGQDKRGSYAMIQEAEMSFPDGYKFKVEVMPEEGMPYGCMLILERINEETLNALARGASVMTPPKQFVGVSLDFDGSVDGDGGGRN